MKMRGMIKGVIMATTVVAMPVMAQDTGSHLVRDDRASVPINSTLSPPDRTRAVTIAYASCQLQRNRVDVERAAALPPGPESDRAFQRLMPSELNSSNFSFSRQATLATQDDCLTGGTLNTTPMLLRGAAYVVMYKRDFGRREAPLIATAPDYTAGGAAAQSSALLGLASCVVRRDPTNSRRLVLAPVGSSLDSAAFGALTPSFNACTPSGMSMTFSKQVLQGILAEALYRETTPRERRQG